MPSPQLKFSFARMRGGFFFTSIIILSFATLYILWPFLYPIFWAAVIAVMFHPFNQWLQKHIRHASIAALLTTTLTILVILLPLFLVGMLAVEESLSIYKLVADKPLFDNVGSFTTYLQQTPVGPYLEHIRTQWAVYATSATKTASTAIFSQLRTLTQNSIEFLFMLFLMLYTLYYFLKDGERMAMRVMHLSPLGREYEMMLYERFASTVRATLKSAFVIGLVQGGLGALLFWATGVPGAVVWGIVMATLSILPGVGAFLVWLPAGIIMLLMGQVWQGIAILLVGTVVISVVDNLIRPSLVGKDTQMHPLFVLLATLGGLLMFGVSGFVIGPIIAALFLSFLSMYDYYYRKELEGS